MDISKIDKNFSLETNLDKADIKFYDVKCGKFDIYGLHEPFSEEQFHRMPFDIAKNVSNGIAELNYCTAGGRIRFKTTSKYVTIYCVFHSQALGKMGHMPTVGASGFDLYTVENGKAIYYKSFVPTYNFGESYEQIAEFPDNSEKDIIIHMPLYNGCKELYIGLQQDAMVCGGSNYKYVKPIVFYGSSITQGGCASRPGNAYPNYVSRYFDIDFINLGSSGNCRGEDAMAEYLASLDMSIFVYDYDHNAPNAEHLKNTHEKLFKTFRKVHPDTPVIFMTKTDIPRTQAAKDSTLARRSVILETYENAVRSGDKNVYFLDGQEIFKIAGYDSCTVDGCHPNDLGFYCMGQAVIKVIEDNNLLK